MLQRMGMGLLPGTTSLVPGGFGTRGMGMRGGAVVSGPQTYEETILASNPVGYWRLGESSGTVAADSSGNALHGTYVNAPTLGVAGAIAGDADKAVTLNGVDEYVTVASSASLALGDAFTLECWYKVATIAGYYALIAEGSQRPFLYLNPGGNAYLHIIGLGNIAYSSVPAPTGRWVHIVATKNGADRHIYFDGVEGTILEVNQTAASGGSTALYIGNNPDTTNPLNGSIDEVAIYARALPAAEVLAHYNAGIGA